MQQQGVLMKRIMILALMLLVILQNACISGSGWLEHHPPKIRAGTTSTIQLRLGVTNGNADRAYKSATMHYDITGKGDFISTKMERINTTEKVVLFTAEIPSLPATMRSKQFIYYFTFDMDGTERRHPEAKKQLSVTIE